MNYCLEWRLVGRASRLLDQGEIDGDLADRASALQALHAFLLTFAVRGRNDAEDYWWGRRSADADLEVQGCPAPNRQARCRPRRRPDPDLDTHEPQRRGE